MTAAPEPPWVELCRAEGLDPAEVRLVLGRYRAYRDYYRQGGRGEPLPLAVWFRWYRLENATEAGDQAPAPVGCSIDDDARNRGLMNRPEALLRVLTRLEGALPDGPL